MKIFLLLIFPLSIFAQNPYEKVESYLEKRQYKQAENYLQDFLNTYPYDLKAKEYLGDTYGQQEKWDEAIEIYEELVDAEPKNADFHYKYGGSMGLKALKVNKLKALTMIDDIKEAFTTSAKLDPKHIDTRWALVELYMQLPAIIGGSTNKAIGYAKELQEISKVDGYLAKGYIYEQDGDAERAEKYYKAAIKIGGSMTCYDKLTNLYESEDEPLKAISNLEEAQEKHKRNAIHYQIGKVSAEYKVELDKGENCLLIYIKNYSVADGVPIGWAEYRLAQIYKYKGNRQQALKHIDLAINDFPKIKEFRNEKEKILKL